LDSTYRPILFGLSQPVEWGGKVWTRLCP
jgi:hypothetical protein